jgi:hypothetical protein
MDAVVLDTCVLLKSYLCDTALLSILAGPGQGCPEFARKCRTLL